MLLVTNGRVITRDSAQPYLERGAVALDGALIREVGPADTLSGKYPDAQVVDARGGVIMPGLINAHEHIYSSFARGLSLTHYAPRDFMDILSGMWWRIDRGLTNEDTRWSAYASYVDCIKMGVTTVFDHHASYGQIEGSLFTLSAVAKELGVRTCLCYEVSDRDGADKMRAAVAENEAFAKAACSDPMQAGMMGLHAALDYAVRMDTDTTGGRNPQEYNVLYHQVQLYLGMSFRQKLIDQVFIYEHAGLETGYGTKSAGDYYGSDVGPHIIFGAYGDVGVAYMPIAGLTVTAGARLELGMEYSTEFEIDTVIYAGVGYGF